MVRKVDQGYIVIIPREIQLRFGVVGCFGEFCVQGCEVYITISYYSQSMLILLAVNRGVIPNHDRFIK